MTKTYPTEVLLSITTGCLLCDFSDMHECCEFVAGEPIFTHQFAHAPFVAQLKDAVFAQHPQLLSVDPSAVDTTNWQAFRDEQIKRFGPTLDLIPMEALITSSAESFEEPLRGNSVIVLDNGGDAA